jgi:hypothetical protein
MSVEVDWSDATLEPGVGNRFWVTAPIGADHDDMWDLTFRAVLQDRADVSEDSWGAIGLLEENIVVGGVARQSMDAVRTFVDECVESANEHAASDRAERLHALQEQVRAQDEEARRLTEQLRAQSTARPR